jgi:hypothetical protein
LTCLELALGRLGIALKRRKICRTEHSGITAF